MSIIINGEKGIYAVACIKKMLAIFVISNHYHLNINLDISYYPHEGEK
jgi:hypothetical protein